MSFTVTINISRTFNTAASFEKVFELLSDVAVSGSCFPKVEKLTSLGGNIWKWEMERIGFGEHVLQQTIYACKYVSDKEGKTVTWSPVEGVGNAVVEGKWEILPIQEESKIELQTRGMLRVGMPGFLEFFLSPLITLEFERLVDQYIANLKKELADNQAHQ